MLQTVGIQPGLKEILERRAKTYTSEPSEQRRLVERTISRSCDNPDILEGPSLKNALSCVMHDLVRAAIRQAPEDREKPPSQRVDQRA